MHVGAPPRRKKTRRQRTAERERARRRKRRERRAVQPTETNGECQFTGKTDIPVTRQQLINALRSKGTIPKGATSIKVFDPLTDQEVTERERVWKGETVTVTYVVTK